jgi:hypothetical protein
LDWVITHRGRDLIDWRLGPTKSPESGREGRNVLCGCAALHFLNSESGDTDASSYTFCNAGAMALASKTSMVIPPLGN